MKRIITPWGLIVALMAIFVSVSPLRGFAIGVDFSDEVVDIYEVDGIIYKVLEWDELPLPLEVIGVSEDRDLQYLIFPEEITIQAIHHSPIKAGPKAAKIVKIGSNAFAFKRIGVLRTPSTIQRIGERAFVGTWILSLELSEGLRYIGEQAFSGARFGSVVIPEGVQYLDYMSFAYAETDHGKIDLPSSLVGFGGRVFFCCTDNLMMDIYFRSEIPPTTDGSDFGFIDNYIDAMWEAGLGPNTNWCTLHVPAQSLNLYKSTFPYNQYFNIVPIEEEEEPGNDDEPSSAVESSSADVCAYSVKEGVLTVACGAGDTLRLYDGAGILLESKSYSFPSEYTYIGNGVRILSVNGKSYKIVL